MMVYAFSVHWLIAPVYFLTVPLLGVLSSVLSRAHQDDPEGDRRRDDGAGRLDDRVAAQHRAGEEPRARRSRRSRGSTRTTGKILKLELKKVRYLRSLSFIQGTAVNLLRTSIMFLMLYLIYTQRDHGRAVLLAVHLLVLHLRPAAGARERHQHLPRDRSVAQRTSRTSCRSRRSRSRRTRCRCDDLRTLAFDDVSFQHQIGVVAGAQRHLVRASSAARRSRSSGRRAPARRRW